MIFRPHGVFVLRLTKLSARGLHTDPSLVAFVNYAVGFRLAARLCCENPRSLYVKGFGAAAVRKSAAMTKFANY